MKKFKQFVNEAYVDNEKTKQVREDLKKEFPDFKFSVRKENSSSVDVAIISGPIPLLSDDNDRGYEQVNHYYIKDHYEDNPEARDFLLKVLDIINMGNHDNSDSMTDYFDVGFYVSLTIGKWNKPYIVTKPKSKKTKASVIEEEPKHRFDIEEEIPSKRSLRYFESFEKFNESLKEDIEVGDTLVCICGKDEYGYEGRIEIYSGDEARSADVYKGDKFIVRSQDKYRVYGDLQIKGKFERNPGLSGHDPDKLKTIPIPTSGIVYCIMKRYINNTKEDLFWACWETYDYPLKKRE